MLFEHQGSRGWVQIALRPVYGGDKAISFDVDTGVLEGQVLHLEGQVAGKCRTNCHGELEMGERE